MKSVIFSALLGLSINVFASDFQTGTFTCSNGKNQVMSVWKISALNLAGLSESGTAVPFVDVTYDVGDGADTIRGIGVLEAVSKSTLIGVPNPRMHGTMAISFANDGSVIQAGSSVCVKSN